MKDQYALKLALRRVLRPLARLSIACGLSFQDMQKLLKQAFVDTAERDFQIDGKRLTDSRISLLTGLQRRDIKQISESEALHPSKTNPLQRLHSQLLALGKSEISLEEFEAISRAEYQDIHPRTFLDELARLGLIKIKAQSIFIEPKPMIARDDEAAYEIFADNLSAHARSSVSNLLGEPAALEQAVYATNLSAEDASLLQDLARESARKWLLELNETALKMQRENKGHKEIRIGLYFNQKEKK